MAMSLALHDRSEVEACGRDDSDSPCCLGGFVPPPAIGVTMMAGPGQTIVIEGDPITHYFRIVAGTVRLYKAIADGRRQVIDFLSEGSCFGITGLAHHAYSAEAVSPVTLIRYPRQAIEAAARTDPALAQSLFKLACEELGQAQKQMLLLGRKSADEKIASFLLGLAERARDQGRLASVIHLPMSRQDMADYLGLTIETVSRTMSRFKRLGLISLIGRQHVALCQPARLKALADGLLNEAPGPSRFDCDAHSDAPEARLEA